MTLSKTTKASQSFQSYWTARHPFRNIEICQKSIPELHILTTYIDLKVVHRCENNNARVSMNNDEVMILIVIGEILCISDTITYENSILFVDFLPVKCVGIRHITRFYLWFMIVICFVENAFCLLLWKFLFCLPNVICTRNIQY